jgi:hypothetical protein
MYYRPAVVCHERKDEKKRKINFHESRAKCPAVFLAYYERQ